MKLCGRAEAIVVQVYRLLAKVALVPVWPVVAAHARKAVAGVETLELLRAYLVYVDLAEVDVVDGPHRLVQIGRKNVGGQPVWRVVGEIHYLVEVLERLDRQHGTKDFTLNNVHFVRGIGQHRRLEPVPLLEPFSFRTLPAESYVGPLLYGLSDKGLDLL